jgi:hypothetical protein
MEHCIDSRQEAAKIEHIVNMTESEYGTGTGNFYCG